jgi:peptidoglycan/LPS O-acetylase OafA/YrhL
LARFSRIYPLHFVTLFMMLCAYAVAVRAGVQPVVTSGYTEKNVILTLLLVQEWFGEVAPNPSSWSISIECASYLIFPLLISRLAGVRGAWPLAIILIGAFAVDKLAGVRVARGVIEFVIGCAVYSVSKRYEGGAFRALAAIAFIVPFAAAELAGRELAGLSALCFAATLFLLAGTGAEPFKRLCSTRAAVFFGDISYSVYLLQWFVWIGWKHIIARTPFFAERPYVMVLCAAASLILCATVSYRFFEKPARSWLRKLSRPKIDRDAPRKDRGVRAV